MYNHYIITDPAGNITGGWSNGPHRDRESSGAVLLTDQGGYQFRLWPDGEENPFLRDEYGNPLYRWDGEKVVERDDLESIHALQQQITAVTTDISVLETRLDGDYRYKKRLDGEYTDGEWEPIAAERRVLRQELRNKMETLEELKNELEGGKA